MLACGGRGLCCHIGYAHRHCGHCDVVIPTTYTMPIVVPYVPPYYPSNPYPTWITSTTRGTKVFSSLAAEATAPTIPALTFDGLGCGGSHI